MNAVRIPVLLRSPATLLAVEDEPLVRLMIADHFREKGYRVIEARDAAEALSILRAVDQQIDLVITDIDMPGSLNGIKLAQQVKEDFQLPVILMSGHFSGSVTSAIADAFFAKPFDLEQLVAAVVKLLEEIEP